MEARNPLIRSMISFVSFLTGLLPREAEVNGQYGPGYEAQRTTTQVSQGQTLRTKNGGIGGLEGRGNRGTCPPYFLRAGKFLDNNNIP